MNYDADVAPPGWNQDWSDAEVYERPVPEARYVWFDFFPPDYEWMGITPAAERLIATTGGIG